MKLKSLVDEKGLHSVFQLLVGQHTRQRLNTGNVLKVCSAHQFGRHATVQQVACEALTMAKYFHRSANIHRRQLIFEATSM